MLKESAVDWFHIMTFVYLGQFKLIFVIIEIETNENDNI
jgi:hypothetical protein